MKFRNPKLFSNYARIIATIQICICFVVVVGSSIGCWFLAPERMAQREMERMAREYYETYFYENLFGDMEEKVRNEALKKYSRIGTPVTYLRQLLNYDDGKNSSLAPIFHYPEYSCNTNVANVVFYPQEPYTAKDYTMKITMDCVDNT